MSETPDGSQDELTLRVTPGPGPELLSLRVSPQYFDELLELVRAEGLAASRGAEFSMEQVLQIVSVVVGGGAGMTAVASAVKAFLALHKDKSVKLGGSGELLEVKGYSEKDVEKIMAKAAEQRRQLEDAMRRLGTTADVQADSQRS